LTCLTAGPPTKGLALLHATDLDLPDARRNSVTYARIARNGPVTD
jgi:hypothetical protein